MKEIWKDIPDYEGFYKISNLGKIVSKTGHEKKIQTNRYGYYMAYLSKNGKVKGYHLHQLIAKAFIPNPNNFKQVDHINCNKKDNSIENLEWVTCKENINRAWHNGLCENKRKILQDANNRRKKKVAQYDKSNKLIKIWDSKFEASKKTGIDRRSICYAIKNIKLAGGFLWKNI